MENNMTPVLFTAIERWHKTIKQESLLPYCPVNLQDARRIVEEFVVHYNTKRLHSAIGYIAPQDKLLGREKEIFSERDRKLSEAPERRAAKQKIARQKGGEGIVSCRSVKQRRALLGSNLPRDSQTRDDGLSFRERIKTILSHNQTITNQSSFYA